MAAVLLLSACGTGGGTPTSTVVPPATQVAISVPTSTIELPTEVPTIPVSVSVPIAFPTGIPTIGVPVDSTPTSANAYVKPTPPPGSPIIPIDPTKGPQVTGSVVIEEGIDGFDAPVGQTVNMLVMFQVTLKAGAYGMRINPKGFSECASEAEMEAMPWEIISLEQGYDATILPGINKWYISAQYRDEAGNISPIYCDDITLEGISAAKTP